MIHTIRRSMACAAFAAGSLLAVSPVAHAQFSRLHVGDVAVGATGQFSTILTENPQPVALIAPNQGILATQQRQDTTMSAGFVGSIQMVPVKWAGIQVNYGFTHYQERYGLVYSNTPRLSNQINVPTDAHEFTAGYLVHPKHIPFQPYMTIGGGAIDFDPHGSGTGENGATTGTHQFRGTGLLEAGFDIPTHSKHIGFRISGRSLYYRSPNFDTPQISTRSWRVTTEPAISAVYKF